LARQQQARQLQEQQQAQQRQTQQQWEQQQAQQRQAQQQWEQQQQTTAPTEVAVATTTPSSYSPSVTSTSVDDDPYAAFDRKQAEAEDKAMKDVMEIYKLLEENQIPSAYQYFKKNQIPLKTYIIKEAYDVLESTVVDAYNSFVETMR
jgi:hypothetical protein